MYEKANNDEVFELEKVFGNWHTPKSKQKKLKPLRRVWMSYGKTFDGNKG